MQVRSPPAVEFILDRDYVYHTLRHIQMLERIQTPDEAKFIRKSYHQKRNNLSAKTRAQFQKLKEKLERIAARLDQLNREVDQYLRDHLDHIYPTLLAKIDQKLPRELRDEVYGFMVGQKTVGISSPEPFRTPSAYFAIPGHTTEGRSNHFQSTLVSQGHGRLLQEGHVATNYMLELASVWYKLSTFRFVDWLHLTMFLQTEFHGFNLNPYKLVRSVELFTPVHWRADCMRLAQGLNELHVLKCRANILLSFQAVTKSAPVADPSASVPMADLALLFPGLRELVADEYQVTVKLGYHLKFKVVSEDLTEECWTEKVENHYKDMVARRAARAKESQG